MFDNYYKPSQFEYNDCVSKGACSIPPTVSSFREVMLMLLKHIAYYIVKLENLEFENTDAKIGLINSLSNIFVSSDYSDQEIYSSIINNYNTLIQIKDLYYQACKDKNVTPRWLKSNIKLSSDMNLSKLISLGEMIYREKNKNLSKNHSHIFDVLFMVIQSLASNIVLYSDYASVDDKYIDMLVNSTNILNYPRTTISKLKDLITDVVSINFEILAELGDKIYDKYGPIHSECVSLSSRKGKAILVSGSNLNELYELLRALEGKDIDVYTHSDLLIAHSLSKFDVFKNLYAHYGSDSDNFMLDFATFPGTILLTKNAVKNLEYLYRGRLFCTDTSVPLGVTGVDIKDFSKLIETTLSARGFKTGRDKNAITVGYDYEQMWKKLKTVAADFNAGKIKRLGIIGMTSLTSKNNDFYNELLSGISADDFIISFGAQKEDDNILSINLANNVPLLTRLMRKFLSLLNKTSDRITFFIGKCDANSLSTMIALKNHGYNDIYLSDCPPNSINPATLKFFSRLYGVKLVTSAKDYISDTKKGTS